MKDAGRNEREAWETLYSKRGLQFGGAGNLEPLLARIARGKRVLDIGCGEGKSLGVLARSTEAVGCDFSREALKHLRSGPEDETVLNLVESDMRCLPFGDEKFDGVACVHSISHLAEGDRTTAAQEMERVLVDGGFAFIEAFECGDLRFGQGEELEPSSFKRGNGILTHYFSKGELGGLFHGMQVLSESVSSRRVAYGATTGRRSVIRTLMQKE